jgi:hypothetical protein
MSASKRIYKVRKEGKAYEYEGGAIDNLINDFKTLNTRKGVSLSPQTLKSYISKVNRIAILATGKPYENSKFLLDADKIIKAIESSSMKSKKDYLAAITKLLRSKETDEDILKKYSAAMTKEKDNETKARGDNLAKKKDVEKTNGKTLKEIQKEITNYSIMDSGKLDEDRLINKLLASFYFMNMDSHDLPLFIPRNDLPEFKLVSLNRTRKQLPSEYNYLVVDGNNKPIKIIMKNYKTKATYGTQSFKISPMLSSLLEKYIDVFEKKPGEYLFIDKAGRPFKHTTFANMIEGAMKDILGSKIGIDLARQIVISNIYNDNGLMTINQKNEVARAFLHSASVANEYIRPDLIPSKAKE